MLKDLIDVDDFLRKTLNISKLIEKLKIQFTEELN